MGLGYLRFGVAFVEALTLRFLLGDAVVFVAARDRLFPLLRP